MSSKLDDTASRTACESKAVQGRDNGAWIIGKRFILSAGSDYSVTRNSDWGPEALRSSDFPLRLDEDLAKRPVISANGGITPPSISPSIGLRVLLSVWGKHH